MTQSQKKQLMQTKPQMILILELGGKSYKEAIKLWLVRQKTICSK